MSRLGLYGGPQDGIGDFSGKAESVWTAANVLTGNAFADDQANARSYASTALSRNGDLIEMMWVDLADDTGTFDELLVKWLQLRLGSGSTNLSDLKAEAAADRGVANFEAIADPTAIGT